MIVIITQLLLYYKIFLYFSNKNRRRTYETNRTTRIN
nr:MAG TPA: chitin synthase regulator [Caudoviricetes sp.]